MGVLRAGPPRRTLVGGTLDMLRDVAGLTGVALLAATQPGGGIFAAGTAVIAVRGARDSARE